MKKLIILIFLIFLVSTLTANNNWTGKDKVLHFSGSAFLTYWNYGMCKDILGKSHKNSTYFAISLTLALGTTKEYSDKKLKDTGFSWPDLAYDTAGVVVGLILINNLR